MQKIITVFLSLVLVLAITITQSYGQADPGPESGNSFFPPPEPPELTFVRKVNYEYIPKGETKAIIVNALDINGYRIVIKYLEWVPKTGKQTQFYLTPTITIGTEELKVLHSTDILPIPPGSENNPLQQVIVQLPKAILNGTHLLKYNNNEKWGWGRTTIGTPINQTIIIPQELPKGMIQIWSGDITKLPENRVLCDGKNGTINLKDRFIVGAGNNYKIGAIGGSNQIAGHALTVGQMPSHKHDFPQHLNAIPVSPTFTDIPRQNGNGNKISTGFTGGGQSHSHGDNRPLYYSLAFICIN